MHTTSITLLERLRTASDQSAWPRFVELYTPLLFHWAKKCGLHDEDAADLVQDVLLALLHKLPDFTYDPNKSFRAWLRVVTQNLWRDRLRAAGTRPLQGNDHGLGDLWTADHATVFEDEEYRSFLVSRALKLMQADFQPTSWRAMWEHAVVGRSAAAVAEEFGLTVAAVYCAKFRILHRLRQELEGLLD